MLTSGLALAFENAVACLFEHPSGYVLLRYKAGPRHLADLQAVLLHAATLLYEREWYKLLDDQRLMTPFTEEETLWVVTQWLTDTRPLIGDIYAAVLVTSDVAEATSRLRPTTTVAGLVYRPFTEEKQATKWLRSLL